MEAEELPPIPPAPSWAQIASDDNRRTASPLAIDTEVLEKLKNLVTDTVRVDDDCRQRARSRFQNALYGKLFGKSPPFEIVKASLLRLWSSTGTVQISDLPNGFLLIRCDTAKAKDHLLFGGPWTVQGIVLQLAPWQPCFEPAFMQLMKAMVWVQLHNLPVDYWDCESLEMHTMSIGRLVKVDDLTLSLSRTKFARVCFEIDLSAPLKRGFWIEDGDRRVFVFALYERTPILCHSCGLVGHGAISCPSRREQPTGQTFVANQTDANVGRTSAGQFRQGPPETQTINDVAMEQEDSNGWRWSQVLRRRGRGRGRGRDDALASRAGHVRPVASRGSQQHAVADRMVSAPITANAGCQPVQNAMVLDDGHVVAGRSLVATRGRGGRGGCDRGGSHLHRLNRFSTVGHSITYNPFDVLEASNGPLNQHAGLPSSSRYPGFDDGKDHTLQTSVRPLHDRGGVRARDAANMDVDYKGKGKRKSSSSPPLLLMSSVDQRPESSSAAHRSLVERVEQALRDDRVSSDHQSDSESLDDDAGLEDSEEERTLWEIHKSMQKGSRARKGIQILSKVQKKKDGGKGS